MTPKVSVYILTFNEEDKITDAIQSVAWADEVIVADSFSTDDTANIAKVLGATVVNISFQTFGQIRNDAIAACSHDWVFSLDADERCTEGSHQEMLEILKNPTADAYFVPRRNWFLGRWIMHSGWYPDYRQPQLFRKECMHFNAQDEVHESYTIDGKTAYLKQDIIQIPYKDISQLVHKIQRYSSLGAQKLARKGKQGGIGKGLSHGLWNFFKHYVLKLGFLDGRAGFIIALGNFEGTFYRYAKADEMLKKWNDNPPTSLK
jgi:glycosyltransferase involved in cell wall biosynthesis